MSALTIVVRSPVLDPRNITRERGRSVRDEELGRYRVIASGQVHE